MPAGTRNASLPFGGLYAGLFWVAWVTVVFSGDIIVAPLVSAYETTSIMLVGATLGTGFSMIASACYPQLAWSIVSNFKTMLVVGLVCMVFTYAVGFEACMPVPLFVMSTFISGAAMGLFALRCAVLYAETETRIASLLACICGLSGVLVYTFFSLIAQFHSSLLVLSLSGLLPILGTLVSFLEPGNGEVDLIHDKASETLAPAFWRVVAFMGVIAFSLSVIRGFYPRLLDPMQFASSRCDAAMLLIISFMIVSWVELKLHPNSSFGTLFYWLFMIAVAIMVPAMVLGTFSSISGSLATVSKGILILASWSFLSLWSYKTGMSAVKVFGFGFGVVMTGTCLGYAVGDVAGKVVDLSFGGLFGSVMLLACVVTAVLLLRIGDLQNVLTPTLEMVKAAENVDTIDVRDMPIHKSSQATAKPDEATVSFSHSSAADSLSMQKPSALETGVIDGPAGISPSYDKGIIRNGSTESALKETRKPARFKMRCNLISEEFGLTPREADVFLLLAKHMEVKAIAEELCVSFNTARTHVRHIYGKLGVHNHRELDELIDSFGIE